MTPAGAFLVFLVFVVSMVFLVGVLILLLSVFGFAGSSRDPRATYFRPKVPLPQSSKPKIIMTYSKTPPIHVLKMLDTFAPEFDLEFFDDDAARVFLQKYFIDAIVERFDLLLKRNQKAHAADLMRFCALSVFPGRNLYLDIKTVLKVPVLNWFPLEGPSVTATLSGDPNGVALTHIGIVGGPSEWTGWPRMIDRIMRTPVWMSRIFYLTHCMQFYTRVADHRVTWLREGCGKKYCDETSVDWRGLCCVIKKGDDIVMHSRDPKYPY